MTATRRAQGTVAKPTAAAGRIDQMLSGVRAAGLKLTPQRVAIVRALAGDPTHPTAQEIFDRLQSSMPTMSFATVYNTLDALTAAGLCGSLSLSPGPSRFDPNMVPHHHAVCDGCGLVRDVLLGADATSPARRPAIAPARRPAIAPARRPAIAPARGTTGDAPARRPAAAPAVPGFEVRAVEHIYRGLCAACAALDARGPSPRSSRGAPRREPPIPSTISSVRHARRST